MVEGSIGTMHGVRACHFLAARPQGRENVFGMPFDTYGVADREHRRDSDVPATEMAFDVGQASHCTIEEHGLDTDLR